MDISPPPSPPPSPSKIKGLMDAVLHRNEQNTLRFEGSPVANIDTLEGDEDSDIGTFEDLLLEMRLGKGLPTSAEVIEYLEDIDISSDEIDSDSEHVIIIDSDDESGSSERDGETRKTSEVPRAGAGVERTSRKNRRTHPYPTSSRGPQADLLPSSLEPMSYINPQMTVGATFHRTAHGMALLKKLEAKAERDSKRKEKAGVMKRRIAEAIAIASKKGTRKKVVRFKIVAPKPRVTKQAVSKQATVTIKRRKAATGAGARAKAQIMAAATSTHTRVPPSTTRITRPNRSTSTTANAQGTQPRAAASPPTRLTRSTASLFATAPPPTTTYFGATPNLPSTPVRGASVQSDKEPELTETPTHPFTAVRYMAPARFQTTWGSIPRLTFTGATTRLNEPQAGVSPIQEGDPNDETVDIEPAEVLAPTDSTTIPTQAPGYEDSSLDSTVVGVDNCTMGGNHNILTAIPMQLNVKISPAFATRVNSNVGVPTLRMASWDTFSGDPATRNSSQTPGPHHVEGPQISLRDPGVMALTAVLSVAGRAQLQHLRSLGDLSAFCSPDRILLRQIIDRIRSMSTGA
ncbi:hypothetical protein FA13DRAFT_1801571 [Coprinellus micaceus]|uniref:Uncharacterized protein n=1 Tax=Coprinellus micaceus TaxID=71717 RepID=A0A4Y7SE45_COPMI|nr:hypothetical protein FA13DRAFT_1801571 [Coprinellus micaceus]